MARAYVCDGGCGKTDGIRTAIVTWRAVDREEKPRGIRFTLGDFCPKCIADTAVVGRAYAKMVTPMTIEKAARKAVKK